MSTDRSIWKRSSLSLLGATLLAFAGCAGAPGAEDELGIDDFLDGKGDTGYYSNRAAEIISSASGWVRVMLPGRSDADLAALAAAIKTNSQAYDTRDLVGQISQQVKYARNELIAHKFDANLEGSAPTIVDVKPVAGGLDISYRVEVESLVKYMDLEKEGKKPKDLVGTQFDVKLPLVPAGLFSRIGSRCGKDPDGDPYDPSEVSDQNLFYYYYPAAQGCPLTDADLSPVKFQILSSAESPTVFPEYDRLIKPGADGVSRVDAVAIFGQIDHGELSEEDPGIWNYKDFTEELGTKGFSVVEEFPEGRGHRMEKKLPGGLIVRFDMLTPVNFMDHGDKEAATERFREAIRGHELVYYEGHAFYGSLDVLKEKSAFPANAYQIFFMNACWSYAYYTKQIFDNKTTPTDSTGWLDADVINNTEMGDTGDAFKTARAAINNLFTGADRALNPRAYAAGSSRRPYSWQDLIRFMNQSAQFRYEARVKEALKENPGATVNDRPEIYGVSGVRTNKYKP